MDDYRPISCGLHSEYELLAMRRAEVSLIHRDDQGCEHRLRGRVEDVFTRQGAEYLRLRQEDGAVRDLRLDRIRL
jgi:transcriptional antiterminator Rof (Rho-off)